jgi:hypothetical protein
MWLSLTAQRVPTIAGALYSGNGKINRTFMHKWINSVHPDPDAYVRDNIP